MTADNPAPHRALTALVSGANRGLGFAITHELASHGVQVYAGYRNSKPALPEGAVGVKLDVLETASVVETVSRVLEVEGHLDILVNNAGVYLDDPRSQPRFRAFEGFDPNLLLPTMDVNVNGAARLIMTTLPAMRRRSYGRIVNVSSGRGRLSDLDTSGLCYRLSKLALNGLTAAVAREVEMHDILVNSVCPGWVRTAMGGTTAPQDIFSAARDVVWAALLPRGGPSGMLLRNRGVLQDLSTG